MSQPWETIETRCANCSRTLRVPAARRRRERRLGIERPDFCGRQCNAMFVAKAGRAAQAELAKPKITS